MHFAEAGLLEQGFIFAERSFLAFGAGQHVEALHLGPAWAGLVLEQQLLGNQQGAVARQLLDGCG